MHSLIADGMDFFDVYEKAGEAIARARRGDGPTLLECKTYRFAGHYVGDTLAYRTKEETEMWKQKRDPLDLFEARVRRGGPGRRRTCCAHRRRGGAARSTRR